MQYISLSNTHTFNCVHLTLSLKFAQLQIIVDIPSVAVVCFVATAAANAVMGIEYEI